MWFLDTPIYNIFVMAIFGTAVGFLLLVTLFIWQRKIKKIFAKYENTEDDAVRMPLQKKFNMHKMLYKLFFILASFTLVLSLVFIILFASYKHRALEYGAYGDFDKQETMNTIKQRIRYGYKDQSEELPDDLSGCIIIFIKFGCPDCENVHDNLLKCLDDNNVENVYFVSSRSEKGKEMVKEYNIQAVPSGTYFKKNGDAGSRYSEILYTEIPEVGQTDRFVEENMMKLIYHQQQGD